MQDSVLFAGDAMRWDQTLLYLWSTFKTHMMHMLTSSAWITHLQVFGGFSFWKGSLLVEAIILELLACQPYDFALGTSILTLNYVWFQCAGTLLHLTSQFLKTVLRVSLCKMWQLHKPDYYTSWLFQYPILTFYFGKFILLLLALWCVVLALVFH